MIKQITNVVLSLRNLRTLVGIITKGISNFNRLGFGSETLKKLIIDPSLNEDSRSGTAYLTLIPTSSSSNVSHGEWSLVTS